MLARTKIDIERILSDHSLFAELGSGDRLELARAARIATLQRNQALYLVGDPVREMHLLLSGQVKLALTCNRGGEKIVELIEPGRSFGEAELFCPSPYLVNALAVRPSQLLCIAGEDFCRVMTAHGRSTLRIVKALAQRQIELESELAANRSGTRRLLDFFLQLAGPIHDRLGETPVTLSMNKQLLASRFGMQPETLSRALRELTDADLIAVDGRHIRLNNGRVAHHLAAEAVVPPAFATRRRRPHSKASGYALKASSAPARTPDCGCRPLRDAINMAGRQRMLSQRMAKSWLMIERGVMSRRARLVLRQSVAQFDRQFDELGPAADCAETRAACAELGEVWGPYRALLDADPGRRAARRLFGLNEEVLAAAQRLTMSFERADGTNLGKLVNLAGRERMLSQRMAKFFLFRHMGIHMSKCRSELETAHQEFSNALIELAAAARDKPRIMAELQRVARHWQDLQPAMVIQDDSKFAPIASRIFTASELLLRRMDVAVKLYAKLPA